MRSQKRYISLSAGEYRMLLYALIRFRNKLISQGRYTDAVDELILKIVH